MIIGWSRNSSFPPAAANLKLWLKADAITGFNDGDDLTTWEDESGNNNDFTASGNNIPKYRTSTLLINSLPVVEFSVTGSGTNQALKRAHAGFATDSWSAATVVIVGELNADPPTNANEDAHPIQFSRPVDGSMSVFPFRTDSIVYDESFTTARKTVGNPTPSLADPYYYLVYSGANTWEARLNGSSIFSTGTNTYKGNTADSNIGWGQHPPAGTVRKYKGVIGEIMCWDAVLSAGQISTVEATLAAKWGI